MALTRTRRRVLGVVPVVALLGATGWWAYPQVAHRRDEARFQSYVTKYVAENRPSGPSDLALVKVNARAVLTEGDNACQWLEALGPRRMPFASLMEAYQAQVPTSQTGLSEVGRGTVIAGAWEYLCWSTREAHMVRIDVDD